MLVTVGLTTVAWLLVTWLTPPEPREKLVAFYRRVRPGGPGWEPIKAAAGSLDAPTESLGMQFYNWILGCTLIYATLFGIGKIIFKEWPAGLAFIAVAVVAGCIDFSESRAGRLGRAARQRLAAGLVTSALVPAEARDL